MSMKITRLETIWLDEQPNTTWVRIHTDDGLIGLGETFYVPRAISAMVHDVFANLLLGRSAFDIEKLWQNMFTRSTSLAMAAARRVPSAPWMWRCGTCWDSIPS